MKIREVQLFIRMEEGENVNNYCNDINDYIKREISILKKLDVNQINEAINLIDQTLDNKGKIYIFGNGGSATTALHYQNDFNDRMSRIADKKFEMICLNDNIATIMAIANDIGYDEVFRRQLLGKIEKNDIVIAISVSGNSRNVIKAAKYANSQGNKVVGITGGDGGILKNMADISLHVPVDSMQIAEDIHLMFNHLISDILIKLQCDMQV